MADAEAELSKIFEFLKTINLGKTANVDPDDIGKDIYRKFYALLCWQLVLDRNTQLKSEGFFDEFLSDSAAAYLFLLSSTYKPCVSMLRSSVENIVRSILLLRGVQVKTIEAVWELFTLARTHFRDAGEDWVVIRIDALHVRYGEMCKTVHSASPEYMSLRVPFERVFGFDEDAFAMTRQLARDVFRLAVETLYLVSKGNLGGVHHRVADEIRDATSPSTKALVSQEGA